MISKLEAVKKALLSVTENVGHHKVMDSTDKYIVWQEDSEGSAVGADNQKTNQSIQGTIDYYTKTDMDENVDKIQAALNAACISFYLNSVQYEDETELIHYEWVFEVT